MLTFKIEDETDLHIKVVSFLKMKRYPHSLFTVTLGENQNTSIKRYRIPQERVPSRLSRFDN